MGQNYCFLLTLPITTRYHASGIPTQPYFKH